MHKIKWYETKWHKIKCYETNGIKKMVLNKIVSAQNVTKQNFLFGQRTQN